MNADVHPIFSGVAIISYKLYLSTGFNSIQYIFIVIKHQNYNDIRIHSK